MVYSITQYITEIRIISYEGELTSRQEELIKTVVDSIVFTSASPAESSMTKRQGFTHTDPELGVTFNVPAGWEEKPLSKPRDVLKAKFASSTYETAIITFGYVDMWEQMSPLERLLSSRATINNDSISKEEFAEMFGVTADKVSLEYYNNIGYFRCEQAMITGTMTGLYHIDNGIMYTFQFSGSNTHAQYGDFEKLLNSVNYP